MLLLLAQALVKTGQAQGRGPPGRDIGVVADDPAQRVLHLIEGRAYLHELTQLDGATEKRGAAMMKGKTTAAWPKKLVNQPRLFAS
jgi:hypothetical protein